MSFGLAVAQAGERDRPKSDAIDWLPTAETPLADAALRYAEHGLVVIPLHGIDPATLRCLCGQTDCAAGKHPIEKGWQHQRPDVQRTRRQFAQYEGANVGLVMGGPCRLLTIDIDGPKGREALAGLERKLGALPDTLISRSGRADGGEHRLFVVPETLDMAALKNRALAPHVDVRTTGGQIVVAPSLHSSGNRYAWVNHGPIAAIPEAWYQHMVGPKEPPRNLAKPRPLTAPRVSRSAYSKSLDRSTSGDRKKEYVHAALQNACDAIRKAPDGSRNDVLNTQTYSIAGLVASGHLDAEQAYPTLEEAAIEAGLQIAEIQTTMASAIRNGEARPREIPEPRKTRSNAVPAQDDTVLDPDDPGPQDPEKRGEPTWALQYTDVLNAEQFVREHGDSLRYCLEREDWLKWGGQRWVHDPLAPSKLAQQTARSLAAKVINDGLEKPWKIIERVLRISSVSAMIHLARAHLVVKIDEFDADQWLFNCDNGTLAAKDASFRRHNPNDLITRQSPVAYDPNATCPTWSECLARWLPDPNVRAFVQRLAGYWLTGEIREHVLPVFWGKGGNGKSTFLETLLYVMGDYAAAIPASTLMEHDHEQHPTERARLKGLRLAVASESKEQKTLDDGTVKLLTGGDTISARFMHKDFFEFEPTHKLVLITNHKPRIKGTDEGIWRRVLLVPWTVVIPESQRDTKLKAKLRAEAPGILKWIVDGCLAWQREGLNPPEAVRAATAQFRGESDTIGRFLSQRCTTRIPSAVVSATDLYRAFEAWCREEGETPSTQTRFGRDLVDHHDVAPSVYDSRGRKMYRGIGLLDTSATDSSDSSDSYLKNSPTRACEGEDPGKPSEPSEPSVDQNDTPAPVSMVAHPSQASPLGAHNSGSHTEGRFRCPRHGTAYRPECGSCGPAFDDEGNLMGSVP